MTTFDRRVDAGEPRSPWDPVPDVVQEPGAAQDAAGPGGELPDGPDREVYEDEPDGPAPTTTPRRRRHVGRLVAVLVVATVLGLLVADVLIGRLAFTTRQEHWASAFNDPTVARPDRGAPSLVLQVEDLDVNVVVAEGSAADIVRGGPGLVGGSPLPGEPGNAVIVGRSSRFGAPFSFVEDLSKGATVVVRQKAGQVARFEVTEVEVVDESRFEAIVGDGVPVEGADEDVPATLTLVTSAGGPLDSRRRVARAELTGLSPAGAVAVAETSEDATGSTTTTAPEGDIAEVAASGEADEEIEVAEDTTVERDPGRRPGGFDVRSPSVVLTLVGGLLVVALAAAAIPELRRRHSTATVVVVAAPAVALGLVLMLMSLDAILPVTY